MDSQDGTPLLELDRAPTPPEPLKRGRVSGALKPILIAVGLVCLLVGMVVAGTDLAWRNLVPAPTSGSASATQTAQPGPNQTTIATVVSALAKVDATHSRAARCTDEAADAVLIRLETLVQGGDPAVSLQYYWQDLTGYEHATDVFRAAELTAKPYDASFEAGDLSLPSALSALASGHGVLPAITKTCTAATK